MSDVRKLCFATLALLSLLLPACDSTKSSAPSPSSATSPTAITNGAAHADPLGKSPPQFTPGVGPDAKMPSGESCDLTRIRTTDSQEKQSIDAADDPGGEGWETEVFQQEAKKQLYAIAALLEHGHPPDVAKIDELLAENFSCGPLRPEPLDEVFADSQLKIRRWTEGFALDEDDELALDEPSSEPSAVSTTNPHTGAEQFAEAFHHCIAGLVDVGHLHFAFKVFGIQQRDGYFTTKQFVTTTGTTQGSGFEQNSLWVAAWVKGEDDKVPLLRKLEVRRFEEAVILTGGEKIFNECTEAVLQHDPSFHQSIVWGIPYWMGRIDNQLGADIFGHQGVALGDVNGDGLDDIYMCQSGGIPNQLFVRNPDGTATDMAAEAGVNWNDLASGALLVDLDNDGDQDLILSTRNMPTTIIMSNDGQGRFKFEYQITGVDYINPSAGDYDNDGDLDVYLCAQFTKGGERFPSPMPIHDANNGGRNVMLRNDGNFQFTDVTEEVGLDVNNRRFSFAASWDDYDGDGDLDIYVANDWGRNNLYRNDGGKFVDVTEASGAEDGNFGMSVSWGDPNRDGRPDIYIANMFSSAGMRVMSQDQFKPAASTEVRQRFRKLARGNTLLLNDGGSHFDDVSDTAGVTVGRWAWGSNFVDINNDGWEDLIVANGYVTNTRDPGDL